MSRDEGASEMWRSVYSEFSAEGPAVVCAVLDRAEACILRLSLLGGVGRIKPRDLAVLLSDGTDLNLTGYS
jgi:hypothetical protein